MSKKLIIACVFFLLTGINLFATVYYVSSSSGDDSYDGLYPDFIGGSNGPWRTVSKVNSATFLNGDTLRFRRGDTWNDSELRSPLVDDFTFEDYGVANDPKPFLNGDSRRPIVINDSNNPISNLTIRNFDISGQDAYAIKTVNVEIGYVDGLVLDGIYGNGAYNGNDVGQEGNNAINIINCSGNIEIKNCELFNWGPDGIVPSNGIDLMGITIMDCTDAVGLVQIHDNIIHDISADLVQLFRSTTPIKVYSNTFYNFGEQCIDIKGTSNVEIYSNDFSTRNGFASGTGGTGAGLPSFIGSTALDGYRNDNVSIYDNIFRDCSNSYAIYLTKSRNSEIYRNLCKNTKGFLQISIESYADVYHNRIIDTSEFVYNEGNLEAGMRFFNNSAYISAPTVNCAIRISNANGTEIKNNTIYYNNNIAGTYVLQVASGGTSAVINNNIFFNPSNDDIVDWNGTVYTKNDIVSWRAAGHLGDKFEDPRYVSIVSGAVDLNLQSSSPAIDAGDDMGLTQDSEGNPLNGTADIGAYEYIAPELVLGLKMDAISGGYTLDDSGYNNDGLIYDSPTTVVGKINNALQFDGVNDYVNCGTDSSLNISDKITIAGWIYSQATVSSAIPFCRGYYAQDGWYIWVNNGNVSVTLNNSDNAVTQKTYSSLYNWIENEWHHLAVTIDNTNLKIKFYVDGELKKALDMDFPYKANASRPLLLGRLDVSSYYYWPGKLDDIRVYKGAMNDAQVSELYNQSTQKGHWKLDQTADDYSIYANDGTLYSSPTWSTGIIDGALQFDGIDDYVNCGTDSSLNISDKITIAGWIYSQATGNNAIPFCRGYYALDGWYIWVNDGNVSVTLNNSDNAVTQKTYSSLYNWIENEWHHLAVTIDNTNLKIKFYVDGELEKALDMDFPYKANASRPLLLGRLDVSSYYYWPGKLDGVRVYNKILTDSDILFLYNL